MDLSPASKVALLFSGLFLLNGMVTGVWKYAKIMASPEHTAPVYVDIAHRTSFFYSFASLVIAASSKYDTNPIIAKFEAVDSDVSKNESN